MALIGLIGCAIVLGHPLNTTASAWMDAEYGDTGTLTAVNPRAAITADGPSTYLGGTMVSKSRDGAVAYIWGYRGDGLSGTGVATVAGDADVSVVSLPGGRRIAKITGGGSSGQVVDTHAAIGALATDGTVWTWGQNTGGAAGRLGRPSTPTSGKDAGADNWRPGQVTGFPDGARIVDLQSGGSFFGALTDAGELYTWGVAPQKDSNQGGNYGELGQGDNASSARPRRILTGIHSFAVGRFNAWAITAPGWTKSTYLGVHYDGSGTDTPASTTAPDDSSRVLFWGDNSTNTGAASGSPGNTTSKIWSPEKLADGAKLDQLLSQGNALGPDDQPRDDNFTLGVAMGSPEDRGTFAVMTGHMYGYQVLLRDGSLYLWGYSKYFGTGTGKEMLERNAMVPTEVKLDNGNRRVVQLAHTLRVVFLLDDQGAVWMYGYKSKGEATFPGPSGSSGSWTSTNTPFRVDGSQSAGWAAGGITAITGVGMDVMLTRDNGTFWVMGGSVFDGGGNPHSIVRSHWAKANNNSGLTGDSQALTQMALTNPDIPTALPSGS
jgi:alpha-tubulin suppressor-like RCC1 family protein